MITIWVPKRLVEVDLYNVAARSPQTLADLSERSYRQRVDYAAQKVQLSGAKIVMLTGPSASGKTTSAHKLADELIRQGTPAHVVSLDNFFRGAEFYPRMPDGTLDYENPDTMDLPLIRQCLRELSETGKTVLPIYDFTSEKRSDATEPVDLQGGVCIVEGIHALNPELTSLVPGEEVYRIYAGLREEYCIDGRRVINTQDIRLCRRTRRLIPQLRIRALLAGEIVDPACAAAPCAMPPPAAAAPKRPLPCGTASWTARPGISRASRPRQTSCWIPPSPTRWASSPSCCKRCAASSCWKATMPSCGTRRPAGSSMWPPCRWTCCLPTVCCGSSTAARRTDEGLSGVCVNAKNLFPNPHETVKLAANSLQSEVECAIMKPSSESTGGEVPFR